MLESCLECQVNTYSNNLTLSCQSCPPRSNSLVATTFTDTCTCNPGATGPNSQTCTFCTPGKYKVLNGPSDCINCPANTYLGSEGANARELPVHPPAAIQQISATATRGSPGLHG